MIKSTDKIIEIFWGDDWDSREFPEDELGPDEKGEK